MLSRQSKMVLLLVQLLFLLLLPLSCCEQLQPLLLQLLLILLLMLMLVLLLLHLLLCQQMRRRWVWRRHWPCRWRPNWPCRHCLSPPSLLSHVSMRSHLLFEGPFLGGIARCTICNWGNSHNLGPNLCIVNTIRKPECSFCLGPEEGQGAPEG